jgi:hypothetical protein
MGNLLTSWETNSFSRRIVLHGVCSISLITHRCFSSLYSVAGAATLDMLQYYQHSNGAENQLGANESRSFSSAANITFEVNWSCLFLIPLVCILCFCSSSGNTAAEGVHAGVRVIACISRHVTDRDVSCFWYITSTLLLGVWRNCINGAAVTLLRVGDNFWWWNVLWFNWSPLHEGILGSGGIVPRILDLGTRWRWVVSLPSGK